MESNSETNTEEIVKANVEVNGTTYSTTTKFSAAYVSSRAYKPKELALLAARYLVQKLEAEIADGDLN